ncbi:hypothetical protein B0H16DRAFT_1861485 [Mycena metata]|uniref:Uncharacterized protein n=1 Tax=Mycena metata TaxID=1033252 RepID=A0AAD7IFS6_9AGAR|nr:hypothetical protein B0H16DRAFT_1861485 [Mycena metata]
MQRTAASTAASPVRTAASTAPCPHPRYVCRCAVYATATANAATEGAQCAPAAAFTSLHPAQATSFCAGITPQPKAILLQLQSQRRRREEWLGRWRKLLRSWKLVVRKGVVPACVRVHRQRPHTAPCPPRFLACVAQVLIAVVYFPFPFPIPNPPACPAPSVIRPHCHHPPPFPIVHLDVHHLSVPVVVQRVRRCARVPVLP